jgi:hypothetical protein
MGQLLHEQGVSGCPRQDEFPKFRGNVPILQDGLDELSAGFEGELVETDPAEVGFVPSRVGVLGSVKEDKKDPNIGEPFDEVAQ